MKTTFSSFLVRREKKKEAKNEDIQIKKFFGGRCIFPCGVFISHKKIKKQSHLKKQSFFKKAVTKIMMMHSFFIVVVIVYDKIKKECLLYL